MDATTAGLTPEDTQRLSKLLGMLDSPFEGERQAAVAAASRLLEMRGMRWCEVLTRVAPRPPQRQPRPGHWRSACMRLLERRWDLRPWELSFVQSISHADLLTPKQHKCLREIERRLANRRAA
jgi:hypothetical protein